MTFRFLSSGMGVQTTALLLMDTYDEVIFADTKGEKPETYDYMERFVLPYVKDNGIKFTVLGDSVEHRKGKGKEVHIDFTTDSLEDYCKRLRIFPSIHDRWCTEKFKILRIKKYVRSLGIPLPVVGVLGISWDEMHRIHESHSRTWKNEYPLVDKRMTRDDARKIIEAHGWPIPPKSGCWYCPFQRKSGWRDLYLQHPDLFKRAREMEENSTSFPKYVLSNSHVPLKRLAGSFGEGSHSLDEFPTDDSCEAGYCLV